MDAPDLAKAIALYTSAAKKGNPIAQAALGLVYAEGKGVPADRRKAFELFEAAAKQGNGEALSHLAYMYEMGEVSAGSVEPDYNKAATYYQMAVEQNIPSAFLGLAGLHVRGLGVPADVDKAKQLYLTAAEKGLLEAHFYLGEVYTELALASPDESEEGEEEQKKAREENEAHAVNHFSIAADGGFAEAQFELGMAYAEGALGLQEDKTKATHYLQLAAAQGHQGASEYLHSL